MESFAIGPIRAWLSAGKDFAQGAALYAQAGSSTVYQRLFALGESEYSRRVLERELEALVNAVDNATAEVGTYAPPAAVPPPVAPAGPATALLVDVRQQLRAARDERSQLHAQLTAPNLGKKARLALAFRILDLTDLVLELQAAEAHVLAHGRLPGPVATADVTDAAEMQRRLLNLRSQRSKLKKQPARANDLAAVEADIALIEYKLTPLSHV